MPLTPEQRKQIEARIAQLKGEVQTEQFTQKYVAPVEKVSGAAGLGSLAALGIGTVFPASAPVLYPLAGYLGLGSSIGYTGSGAARMYKEGPNVGNVVETGAGALGLKGTGGLISRGVRAAMGKAATMAPAEVESLAAELEAELARRGASPASTVLPQIPKDTMVPSRSMPKGGPTSQGLKAKQLMDEVGVRPPSAPSAPTAPASSVPTPPVEPESPLIQQLRAILENVQGQGVKPGPAPQGYSAAEKAAARARAKSLGSNMAGALGTGLDRYGIEYESLKKGIQQLRAGTGGEDLAQLSASDLESARAFMGKRLQEGNRVAKAGKVHTQSQLDRAVNPAALKAMANVTKEAGFAINSLNMRIAMASLGAAGGAAMGDTPEERLTYAIGGGLAGGMAPGLLSKLGKDPNQAIENITYFSLLSSPQTIAKAGLGAIGGTITKAIEMIVAGTAEANPAKVAAGARIIKALSTSAPKVYVKALMDPKFARATLGGQPGHVPQSAIGGVGRMLTAGDAAAIHAMGQGGVTAEEAARYTLAGKPTTETARQGVELLRGKIPEAFRRQGRMGAKGLTPTERGELSPFLKALFLQMAPFPRTAAQMIERGLLERTPGVAQAVSAFPKARAALSPGASGTDLLARQLLGAGSAYAGYKGEENLPTQLQPAIGAALGPNAVPYLLGYLIHRAQRGDKPSYAGVSQALEQLVPLAQDPAAIFTRLPQEAASRVVPGVVASVARALDPAYNRTTGITELGERGSTVPSLAAAYMARIPGMREKLPEEFAPVDVFGNKRIPQLFPQFGRKGEIAEKFLGPPTGGMPLPPAMSMSDPRLRLLKDMGIDLGPPSGAVDIPGMGGMQLPPNRGSVSAVQKLRGNATEIAVNAIANNPQIRAMPNGPIKTMIIKMLMDKIRSGLSGDLALPTAMQRSQ